MLQLHRALRLPPALSHGGAIFAGAVGTRTKNAAKDSREHGVFFGRTITEAESQEHLIEKSCELGVDIAAVCPYELKDKREHVSQLASRFSAIG